MQIWFARTRWNYDSYADFFRLVELSGFPICFVDEIPEVGVRDRVYIVTPVNGEWNQGIKTDARLIFWQLEYGDAVSIPGVREVWASDSWYAKKIGAKHVLMGSHPALNIRPAQARLPRRYDVAWLAYSPPRRSQIHDLMREQGLTIAPNGWGDARHEVLSSSACMVTVHQLEDFHCMPPLRLAICAAYRLPYITETPREISPFSHEQIITADYGELPDTVVYWTRRMPDIELRVYGYALFEYLCVENTFRKTVENAL